MKITFENGVIRCGLEVKRVEQILNPRTACGSTLQLGICGVTKKFVYVKQCTSGQPVTATWENHHVCGVHELVNVGMLMCALPVRITRVTDDLSIVQHEAVFVGSARRRVAS